MRLLTTMTGLALGLTAGALADYTLTPRYQGGLSAEIARGSSITLDLELTSDAGDVHNSCLFRVVMTQPGLVYESYAWAAPYEDLPPNDFSLPILADLPMMVDESTLVLPNDPGVVDVELTNVLTNPGEVFGEGVLATVTFTVPEDYPFLGTVSFFAVPDTFADGFDIIDTPATALGFDLTINPACAADVTGDDGVVDLDDVVSVLANWGPCPPGDCPQDIDGDGMIGFVDLITVLARWGVCTE